MRCPVLIQMYWRITLRAHRTRLHVPLHPSSPVQYTYSSSGHEGDVPLANSFSTNNFIGKKQVTPPQVKGFSEEYGTNITVTCESPIDMFHCMFTDIITRLVSMPYRNKEVACKFNRHIVMKSHHFYSPVSIRGSRNCQVIKTIGHLTK
jgi:hypothetical protein